MDQLDLARWQFGITTVYHYVFVPITIGLSVLVAVLETAYVRTGKEHYKRAAKFWGKLFLINFAIGVATGLVQEFQFGMAWSDYSRYVGDVFGAPLAIEALLAFFLESTFLGLWIFGWDKLPKWAHAACMWIVAIGTMLSAYFILAANSWMQHPVGYRINPDSGRAELTDFVAVLTNSTLLSAFPHVLFACFMTGAALMIGVSAWHLARRRHQDVMRPSFRLASWVMLVAAVGVVISGDMQARIMTEQQPMKMAAAEALYDTVAPASFSIFTIGSLDGSDELFSVRVPRLLSFLATATWDGEVEGINDVQREEEAAYGPGDYRPNVPVAYWTFRLMIGTGLLAAAVAAALLVLTGRPGRWIRGLWPRRLAPPDGETVPRRVWRIGVWAIPLPILANSFGWIFTEMGRQPWVVYGMLRTADGVSPSVSAGTVATSLTVFTLLYAVLGVIEFRLLRSYAMAGPEEPAPEKPVDEDAEDAERQLAFAY
ncbi:cytochrome ubiquinol oxidase subunit I [Cryptosporangium aurantiacum]|uniref:Cytochrome d ubiquinol oxidase subunit I n=1 Tax=Cryptosporangium aurantiacum TaxID=134849 RepID=A0A1M7QLS9_9ACTN|nr:cytochrome ubiquinol oxidase subunit I [Cryptosporangium aurantiacum]SHN32295.1 cytochrome d ubiquinol oxidase subunit I [Cryptosporangium aurantiacum]